MHHLVLELLALAEVASILPQVLDALVLSMCGDLLRVERVLLLALACRRYWKRGLLSMHILQEGQRG